MDILAHLVTYDEYLTAFAPGGRKWKNSVIPLSDHLITAMVPILPPLSCRSPLEDTTGPFAQLEAHLAKSKPFFFFFIGA